jgi:transcriptional regulator with XRE-family HTH domain
MAKRAIKSPIVRQFAFRLRETRMAKGLSQEALADEAGLHRTYVGSVERGERNISLVNVERLAKALNLTVCELLCGTRSRV